MEYPIIHTMEQGGEDWFRIRCGKITSSRISTVLASGRGGGKSKTRRDYMDDLCSERGTGLPASSFTNSAMEWGTEHEDEAVGAYEREKEKEVQQCAVKRIGFVELSDWIGGSPDGLVGDDGIIEVKCPNSKTQYRYSRMLLADPTWFDPTYKYQMQGNLWVTGRKWCDWISFDPRYKDPAKRLLIVRVPRDEQAIAEIQIGCERFKQEAITEMAMLDSF